MNLVVIRYLKDLIASDQININSEGIDLLVSKYSELLQECNRSWIRFYNKELETNDLIHLNFIQQYKSLVQQESRTLAAEIFEIKDFEMNIDSKAKLSRLRTQAARILWLTKQLTAQQLYNSFIECLKYCELLPTLSIMKIKCFNDFIAIGHEVFTDLLEMNLMCTQYFAEIVNKLNTEAISEEIVKALIIFRNNLTLLSHLIAAKTQNNNDLFQKTQFANTA